MRKIFLVIVALAAGNAMATEEASYDVLMADGSLELRRYEPQIVAETQVGGDFSTVGNKAFGVLADYIFGDNRARNGAGPNGQVESVKIAMTAPVTQQQESGAYRVTFMMPAGHSMETLPVPNNPRVVLTEEPARTMAAIRYSGAWSRSSYEEHLGELESYVKARGWDIVGEPVWARYDAPWTPWFMRRNEVLLPVRIAAELTEK